ncbi:MAG TPA: EAL domain-containing protein [Micromonosporaceae bacterium]|jgi:diguanylate cyclase (GGDEF)-like protein
MFVLLGAVAAVVYLLDLSTIATTAAFAGVGIGCVVALVVGPRWNRADVRRPWTLLAIAAALFLVGAVIRPWSAHQAGATALSSDAFTVPGYIFSVLALGSLLWARRGLAREPLIDGLIVGVGAGVVFAVLFSLPAASIAGRPAIVSALAAAYPLFDMVLVLIVASLAFTIAVRSPSYLLLLGCALLLLIGDVAYAIIGTNGDLTGPRLLDLPFLLAFALLGASALHPSMAELGRDAPVPVQAWGWPRLLLIVPALATPFTLIASVSALSITDRLVLAVGGALLVSLLLTRAVFAVQAYSAAQRRYQHQATHDHLTGLPNRLMLSAQVDRLMAERPFAGSRVWVFFLDLDGFKLINDSRGHQVGDQLIIEVARRLGSCVPDTAEVARVGGDEFVVIKLGRPSEAVELADRILECFAAPVHVRGVEVMITASVGVASAPADGRTTATAEALLRDADTAMYQAKSEGPGKWTMFDASMHERVRERVDIELALRHAVAENQMRVAYQPIVGLTDGTLLGAEALLRWNHPARGAVPPTTFIPVAEDTGMISAIGGWVVRESLRQLATWRAELLVPEDFWISINVSPRQLRDPGLPGMIAEALTQHNLPAHNVVLEITESVTIDQSHVAERVLCELRALGVSIVVDDFGTGFSALGYLRRHPVTGVKIDQAFVGGLGANPEDEEIVRAVVAMSAALGLTVVAEGVETAAQQQVLAALGVMQGQGRLWDPPIEPSRFIQRWSNLTPAMDAGQSAGGAA